MARVVLVQAWPRDTSTGAEVAVRMAGGGSRAYDQLGFVDWRSGIANVPRYTAALGFEQIGWTGGAIPTTGQIDFHPSDTALRDLLNSYFWKDARIEVTVGDDRAGAYGSAGRGKVAGISFAGSALSITFADLSGDLAKPVLPDTFAGTGTIEGPAEATGRPKRRSWGRVFNVEGFLINAAENIYEFGDPAQPLQSFPAVRDKGRAGAQATVAWAGSIAATYAALVASSPVDGGCTVAPSIAMVKWWTQPSGPLTADIEGEVGAGYVELVASIADRIVSTYSSTITVDNLATALTWATGPAGIHAADSNETVGQLLDRLLSPMSIAWTLTPGGALVFKRWTFASPVETLRADTIAREMVFDPLKVRKVGYKKNHRIHNDGEISAALYADDGTPITTGPLDGYSVSPSSWTVAINATANGAIKSGQLPKSTTLSAFRGTKDISEDALVVYSITSQTGALASLSGANDRELTIDSLADELGEVIVSVTYDGQPFGQVLVNLTKVRDGSAVATATDTTIGINNSSSYSGVQGGPLALGVGPGGSISLNALVNYKATSGTAKLAGKFQYRTTPGSGSWTDVSTETRDPFGATTGEPGSLSITGAATGPVDAKNWEFQLLLRKYSGTGTLAIASGSSFTVGRT